MLTAPRSDSTIMVQIEHLHYGKLVSGDEGRVPSSEGHGVTRRSKGLKASDDFTVRLPALLDVKLFDNDLIDPGVNGRGIMLLRTLPSSPNGRPPVVLVRARLRPEDGEGGHSRLHQQAAIWFVEWRDWRDHPSGILRAASELRAIPDRVDDPKRFEVDPLPFSFPRWEGRLHAPFSPGLRRMLNLLVPASENGNSRSSSFGRDDFDSEADFLKTAGEALELLPGNYGRWHEISIASGLRHEREGLFIRYLPSAVRVSGLDIDEHVIRRRLESKSPKAVTTRPIVLTKSVRAATSEVLPVTRATPPASVLSATQPTRNEMAAAFAKALKVYRWNINAENGRTLFERADALLSISSIGESQAALDELALEDHDRDALEAIRTVRRDRASDLLLGALFDVSELCVCVRGDQQFAGVAETILNITRRRLAGAYILFPMELQLIEKSTRFGFLRDGMEARDVIDRSERLRDWLKRVSEDESAAMDQSMLPQLERLCRRLPTIYGRNRDPEMSKPPDGIHRKYVTTLDAVICPHEWASSARETLLQTFPLLHKFILEKLKSAV